MRQWEEAKLGIPVNNDDLNESFRVFRPDLINLIKENHWKTQSGHILLKLYDLHYLTHRISYLKEYKERHPNGIVEIYNNDYKKRNFLYQPLNRGRIAGYGFSRDNPSYHLGIFRSIDQTPHDMRKPILSSKATRCPERLYMVHPQYERKNLKSWLYRCFSNPYNSCYVNGLSGSILLEIRSILFLLSTVLNKNYECKYLKKEAFFADNYALLKNYFLMLTGLFVYFEGGHTFSEIFSVFELKDVADQINEIFQNKNKVNIFSVNTFLIDNAAITKIFKETLEETIKFYNTCQIKEKVCDEVKRNKL